MEAITGSEGPQTPTVPLSPGQVECSTPLPFFFPLSSPLISIFFSLFLCFTPSLFSWSVCSHSLCTKLFSHEPWQRGQGELPTPTHPLFYIFLQEKLLPFSPPPPQSYLNSRHPFNLHKLDLEIPALIRLKPVCVSVRVCEHREKSGHHQHRCRALLWVPRWLLSMRSRSHAAV